MSRIFASFLVVALFGGILVGYVLNTSAGSPEEAKIMAGYFTIVTDIFLRLIKMIIGPLVFSTLVVGISHMGDTKALGRVGLRTLGWFIGASVVSLSLGLLMVNLLQPGVDLDLPMPDEAARAAVSGSALTMREFIIHLVPTSFAAAMAQNEILQIVFFSIFVGVAINAVGHHGKIAVELAESIAQIILTMTGYIMKVAPLAVFAAIAAVVTTQGLGVIVVYGKFIGGFYLSLIILWALLTLAGAVMFGRMNELVKMLREPFLLAFSTASSEAAYPKTLQALERFGISKRIASFVLPVGYSFNLDGTMMYCTFATMFIAQAYGMDFTWAEQFTMLALLMITSKGVAGVPRASLVVIAATLVHFDIPEAGLLLILGVDQFLDMGRSATNVLGNAVATGVVAKWEGELNPNRPETPVQPS